MKKIKRLFEENKILFKIKMIMSHIVKGMAYFFYQICYKWKMVVALMYLLGISILNSHKDILFPFLNNVIVKVLTLNFIHKNIYLPLYFVECAFAILLFYLLCKYFKKKKCKTKKLSKVKNLENGNGGIPYIVYRTRQWNNPTIALWYFNANGINVRKWQQPEVLEDLETSLNRNILDIVEVEGTKNKILMTSISAKYRTPKEIEWNDRNIDPKDSIYILGETLNGKVKMDINKTPHSLIGGVSGSGKTVLLESLIYQALNKNVTVFIADLKEVDFMGWQKEEQPKMHFIDGSLHEQCKVVTTPEELLKQLEIILKELIARKILFKEMKCHNIERYWKMQKEVAKMFDVSFPLISRILFVCDEVATLFIRNDKTLTEQIEKILSLIAMQGRAFGIHLILCTQRPDSEILKGQIKSNLDVRICGRTPDQTLSEVVLGKGHYEADQLINKKEVGLFVTNGGEIFRGYWFDTDKILGIEPNINYEELLGGIKNEE